MLSNCCSQAHLINKYLTYRGGPGSDCDGDSDSNDENNWRNEYPDEDDDDEGDEEYNKFAYDEEFDGGDFGLGRKMRLSDEGSSVRSNIKIIHCGASNQW